MARFVGTKKVNFALDPTEGARELAASISLKSEANGICFATTGNGPGVISNSVPALFGGLLVHPLASPIKIDVTATTTKTDLIEFRF